MTFTRRKTLVGLGASALTLSSRPLSAQAQTLRTRRAFSSQEARDDVAALAEGIRQMRARNAQHPLSFETQTRIHARDYRQHATWRFFPWHRAQLLHFESIIGMLSGKSDFALPYWDWQTARFMPRAFFQTNSPFYAAGRLATARTDFQAARWEASDEVANVFSDPLDLFMGGPDVTGRVESFGHNIIHMLVGGAMNDTSTAPRDPIFWLHHCNIDRVWATWQNSVNPTYPEAWRREGIGNFAGPRNWVPRTMAANLVSARTLGYAYDVEYQNVAYSAVFRRGPGRGFDFVGRVPRAGQTRSLWTDLPRDALQLIRANRGRDLDLAGSGVVRYATQGLKGRIINVWLSAPDSGQQPVTLNASPAFFHTGQEGAEHQGHESYAQIFKIGDDARRLIENSNGRVILSCDTRALFGDNANLGPEALGLDFKLRVTLYD